MWNKHLHIVSLNIPVPANYGGVIDIWYKIKALASIGIKIHLHCFEYGREHSEELNNICYSVNYYKRNTGLTSWFSAEPYIVKSRANTELIKNLTEFDAPILFEGLHTTHYLNSNELKSRIKIVRAHNIEHNYYEGLQKQESNVLKKIYFWTEQKKLKAYETIVEQSQLIASISLNDKKYFEQKYGKTILLPPFHPNSSVNCQTGLGKHILYHGDLSVPENIQAALFLVKALHNIDFPVIFAGRNPSEKIKKAVSHCNIKIVENPSSDEMKKLVENAQIIALPTFQPTGIKLKLIESLYNGRHCVANSQMVNDTKLESLCHVANSANEFADCCKQLIITPFDKTTISKREKALEMYNNTTNAQILADAICKLL